MNFHLVSENVGKEVGEIQAFEYFENKKNLSAEISIFYNSLWASYQWNTKNIELQKQVHLINFNIRSLKKWQKKLKFQV